MSLLDEFREASRPNRPRCTVSIVLEQLDDERAEALREAMEAPDITGVAIARVVGGWGHRIRQETVNRHRRGVCTCADRS